jgi:DNA (cytosine-5)-methyltransferase 1
MTRDPEFCPLCEQRHEPGTPCRTAARPVLLDLFCCQGGAATGYHRAGFDVIGVDIAPQPRYPFQFVQANALEALESWNLSAFAAIHASPPCHDHSALSRVAGKDGSAWLLQATRERLERSGRPWVIENVPGAPMRTDYRLCGCQFGLRTTWPGKGTVGLRRERWFETSWHGFGLMPPHRHDVLSVPVYGDGVAGNRVKLRGKGAARAAREVMGIDWMNRKGLDQAIPPAYTEHIGRQLIDHLAAVARG